ncbi:MAG: hypothetical protein IKE95_09690 [Methanobrevibacter sp.]|nr:hypothetical protein [Methanobrevibacter sp.]
MAVSNYLAKTQYGCRYNYSKLKDVIYLVSEEHLKKVYIDNGEAYISGLTESPLKIEGFNIEFKEETSLDERYKFQKTLTMSAKGIPNITLYRWANIDPNIDYWCEYGNKYYKEALQQNDVNVYQGYYLILETIDGTFYMINVDFPSKATYTYNLSNNTDRTDFSFTSLSNFPALELKNFTPPDYGDFCNDYNINGIKELRMLENQKVVFAENTESIVSTEAFKTIEYIGDSCMFQERFDGDRFTTTLEFQIGFDGYKTSWHYNLLEFVLNRYAAIISLKNTDDKVYAGLNYGFEAQYSIDAKTEKGQSDIITITLTQISNNKFIYGDYPEQINSTKHWRYIKKIKNHKSYECVGRGSAKYLLQEECDCFGNPTGNYKVLSGYASLFYYLNIVGTFSDTVTFTSPDCHEN